jgi:hypothetical protein
MNAKETPSVVEWIEEAREKIQEGIEALGAAVASVAEIRNEAGDAPARRNHRDQQTAADRWESMRDAEDMLGGLQRELAVVVDALRRDKLELWEIVDFERWRSDLFDSGPDRKEEVD